MNNKFLHFLSNTPCNLRINNEYVGSIDNDKNMEIDILTKTNKLYLTYEPISMETPSIPYTTLINITDFPSTNNKNIRIIPFPNNHYDIHLTPFYYYHIVESKTLYNNTVGNYFVSIVTDNVNTKVIIYSGMSIVFSTTITPCTSIKVSTHKEFILIQGITSEDKLYALLINTTNFDIIFNDYISSLEENNDSITILHSCNTLCSHAIVYNLQISTKECQKYYVFESEDHKNNFHPFFIPQAFLECLQCEDEKTLESFLFPNLHNSNINQFKEYFGNIKEFYLNRHNTSPYKVNYTILTNSWHNYTFHINNNQICEIEDIF